MQRRPGTGSKGSIIGQSAAQSEESPLTFRPYPWAGDSGSVHSGRAAEDYTVAGSMVREGSQRGRLCCSSYAAVSTGRARPLVLWGLPCCRQLRVRCRRTCKRWQRFHVSHQFSDGETLFGDDSRAGIEVSYPLLTGHWRSRRPRVSTISAVEGERRYGVPVNGHSKTVGEDRAVLAVSPGVGIEMPCYQ